MSETKPNPKPDGPAKLLGGYATGNLSDAEKQQLFQSALQDQDLFDALMEDQGLHDLLAQPGVKRELIEALQPRLTIWERIAKWLTTPMAWGAVGAVATAAVVLVVVSTRTPEKPATAEYAKATPPPQVQQVEQKQPRVEPQQAPAANAQRQVSEVQTAAKPASPPIATAPAAPTAPPPAQSADQTLPAPVVAQGTLSRRDEKDAAQAQKLEMLAPLAFDYNVTADGVQILATEDGLASLVTRDANAGSTRVVASIRARKGFTETLRFPPNSAGQSLQLMLTRAASIGGYGGAVGAAPAAVQTFRANAPGEARARLSKAKEAEAANSPAPVQSGRAIADAANPTMATVTITVPAR